jgi:hypothetical protein
MWLTSAVSLNTRIPGYVEYLPHHVEMNLRGLMLSFRLWLAGDAVSDAWVMAAG